MKTGPADWYHSYIRSEVVRSIQKGVRLEATGILSLKSKVDLYRSFFLVWPTLEEQERKVTFMRAFDPSRRVLFSLLHDPVASESFSQQFQSLVGVTSREGRPPESMPHVRTFAIATPERTPVGHVCDYHLDSSADNRHVPSGWDCQVLRDSGGLPVAYAPTVPSTNWPGMMAMEELYLGTGELSQRHTESRAGVTTFVDSGGRTLATFLQVGDFESALTVDPYALAFVTLFHGVFLKMHSSRLGDYRRWQAQISRRSDGAGTVLPNC